MQQQMYKTRLLKIFPSSIRWKYYKVGLSLSQRVLKLGTQVDFHLVNGHCIGLFSYSKGL